LPNCLAEQGCQMVCFQTKNHNLGKICRFSDWKMLTYFMAIWKILWTCGIFYDHLAHCVFIWYIFLVSVSCTNKNLATLWQNAKRVQTSQHDSSRRLTLFTFMPPRKFDRKKNKVKSQKLLKPVSSRQS
jgi:hypothetical protein